MTLRMHGADRSRIGGGSHASPARHDEVSFDLGHSNTLYALKVCGLAKHLRTATRQEMRERTGAL